jgi:cytidine deaminase
MEKNSCQELLARAWEARETAYAPYSKFRVGAALLTSSGDVFLGCNVENVSLGLTICAERVAAATAIQAGKREFVALAVAAKTSDPLMPCGACRQFLSEFNPQLIILSEGNCSNFHKLSLEYLLPSPVNGVLAQ